jgi:dihydropteroate synthase
MSLPLIMGILNVTPDSFSDGGRHSNVERAVDRATAMVAAGADIIDVGGESTRPGFEPVGVDTELARVIPVICALRGRIHATISVDTMKPAVARAAVAAGASMWNDVSALGHAPDSLGAAAELACPVLLMHSEPGAGVDTVVDDVAAYLLRRMEGALKAGVAPENIWLDPGIGFAKTPAQSLTLIRHLDRIVGLGAPMLLGASRKRFISAVDPSAADPCDRLAGSIAVALAAARAGAAAVRVHDVRETRQALLVEAAIGG